MAKTNSQKQIKNCTSCGAPVVSEICAYCGAITGLDTSEADMEYPVLECKEATMDFWAVGFPMIFAAAFGIPGLILLIIAFPYRGSSSIFLIGIPFLLIGITALALALRIILRYIKIKVRGKKIQAIVYGYMDDHVLINNHPAQIVKLLIHTPDGPRFILYQLGHTLKIYGIHDSIDILMYQNYFMIR